CRYAIEGLGFDVCIDRNHPNFANELAQACPDGIDIYFENVGGEVFDAVLPLLNLYARIPVCGLIAHYNDKTLPAAPNKVPLLMAAILQKRIHVEGFVILDHFATRYEEFAHEMHEWIRAGKVKLRENKIQGLENAPEAFIGLLQGKNFGKLLVEVASPV
ncbi:MAG TPA: zinc-binding dehydrogenase, partial [Cellvibrio sp.]